MTHNDEINTTVEPLRENQPAAYYCRGCGRPLPQGTSARFHAECLKADKRRRIGERRQREAERLLKWIRRRACFGCRAKLEELAQPNPSRSVEGACEGSHCTSERPNSGERSIALESAAEPVSRPYAKTVVSEFSR